MPKKDKKDLVPFSKRREIFSAPDSYKSLFYGIVTVIVLFVVGISVFQLFLARPKPAIDNEAVSVSRIEEAIRASKNTYTVQEGETLWSIAEEKLGSGFEWTKIADVNKINDATRLESGMALVIPGTETKPKEVVVKETVVASITPTISATPTVEVSVSPTREVQPEEKTVTSTLPTAEKISGNTYVIRRGDDLWNIALRAYGDGYKWVDIARANNLENPDLIHADNTLKLPR